MSYVIKCNPSVGLMQFFPIRNGFEKDNKGNIITFRNKLKAKQYLKRNFLFDSWLGYWCRIHDQGEHK